MESASLTWVLISSALVLFMTPGLAFFYGGMDRRRNVLNMLMMNFYCVLAVPVLWMVLGYSLAQASFIITLMTIAQGAGMLLGAPLGDARGRHERQQHPRRMRVRERSDACDLLPRGHHRGRRRQRD